MNYSVNLNITPGGMPPILHMSQYDTGRTYLVTIKDADGNNVGLGTNPTAKVKGYNGKNCFEIDATVANSVVTFSLTEASTDQFGVFPVTIELTIDGQDTLSPLCMIFDVQRAGYTNEQAANSPEFEDAMEAAAKKYVLGMDAAARTALLDLLAYAAYTGPDAQAKYDLLETALQSKLAYIVADYAQDRTIYTHDPLDVLKEGDDLIVTAYYDDGTHADVEGYTLSGTFTVGTSEITVTYGGKTTTIEVTVTRGVPAEYQVYDYIHAKGTTTISSVSSSMWIALKQYANLNALSCEFAVMRLSGMATAGPAVFGRRSASGALSSFAFYPKDTELGYHLHGDEGTNPPGFTTDVVHIVKYTNTSESPSSLQVDNNTPVSITWVNNNTLNLAPVLFMNPTNNTTDTMAVQEKLGYIKFFDLSGNLVGHYFMTMRKSDNRIGAYDIVDQVFYTSSTASYTTIGNSSCKYEVGNWS